MCMCAYVDCLVHQPEQRAKGGKSGGGNIPQWIVVDNLKVGVKYLFEKFFWIQNKETE